MGGVRRLWLVLDGWLAAAEARAGVVGTGCLVGVLLLGLAAVYVAPTPFPIAHGKYFVALAADPFPDSNPAAHRLLAPLLAYVLQIRGNGLLLLNGAFAAGVLAVAYVYARRRAWRPGLAVATAAALAFSMPTLSTLYNGGYTDSTTYFFLLLMLCTVRVPAAYWSCYFLALWNADAELFLLPFVLLFPHTDDAPEGGPRVRATVIGAVVCLGAYAATRFVHAQYVLSLFNVAYYLDTPDGSLLFRLRQSLPNYYLGFFSVFKLAWLLVFWGWAARWRTAGAWRALPVILPLLCAMAQSVASWDTSRMLSMAFPALLVALGVLRARLGEDALTDLVVLLVLVNLCVPQYYNTNGHLPQMRSLPMVLLYGQ